MNTNTKAKKIIEIMTKLDAPFLRFSSVWDVYHTAIGKSKNSNVYIDSHPFIEKGLKIGAVIGAKGRSQNSKTEVLLFDITNMVDHSFYFNIFEVIEL